MQEQVGRTWCPLDSACGVHILGQRSKLHTTHFMVARHVLAPPYTVKLR
jgi:hypothetical protein